MAQVLVRNLTHTAQLQLKAEYCNTFMKKFMGLMFRSGLDQGEALLFVEPKADRLNTAIHMFFMRFPIAVIWMDANHTVVDAQLARLWPPIYIPKKAAQYTLETRPEYLASFSQGDRICIEEIHPVS
jgi:uncharacterized protein